MTSLVLTPHVVLTSSKGGGQDFGKGGKCTLVYDTMGRMAFMRNTLSSGLQQASYWSINGLRSNLIVPKFQNLSGGVAMPPGPPRV